MFRKVNPAFVQLPIFTRFVLVRVAYLSSSEAYTSNWGLLGKKHYLAFDWWKHFFVNIKAFRSRQKSQISQKHSPISLIQVGAVVVVIAW